MRKTDFFDKTKGGLIVSCQALENEPLYGPQIMARMAAAAMLGGACGIRANAAEDIRAIQKAVNLPVIGIIKVTGPGREYFITPTEKEVETLASCGVDVIAIDATARLRPDGRPIAEIFAVIRRLYPDQLFMADCVEWEDCIQAQELGFDIIATTMRGYTPRTAGVKLPDFELLTRLGSVLHTPVIAEGGIWTPQDLGRILSIPGIHAAVVGSAITRPMEITRRFVSEIPAVH